MDEKEAFQFEREGSLEFKEFDIDGNVVRIYAKSPTTRSAYIELYNTLEDRPEPRPRYLFVHYIIASPRGQGYGILLYKRALQYAKEHGFKGLSSSKIKSDRAKQIWKRMASFSDANYDYVDTIVVQ